MYGMACAAGGRSRASRAPHWSASSAQMSRLSLHSGGGPCTHSATVLSRLGMAALCLLSCEALCSCQAVLDGLWQLPVLTGTCVWQPLTSGAWRPLQCGCAGAAPGGS